MSPSPHGSKDCAEYVVHRVILMVLQGQLRGLLRCIVAGCGFYQCLDDQTLLSCLQFAIVAVADRKRYSEARLTRSAASVYKFISRYVIILAVVVLCTKSYRLCGTLSVTFTIEGQ